MHKLARSLSYARAHTRALFLTVLMTGSALVSPAWADDAVKRAAEIEAQMTLDERIAMVNGTWPVPWVTRTRDNPQPEDAIPAAGYVPGVKRLNIPPLFETDASLGVTNPSDVRPGDHATALPSALSTAASFNPKLAYDGGAIIASEARAKGFNVLLTGGVNLARDPRNGRNFEYFGEDVWLSALMAGEAIRGAQSQKIIATIKHFAVNDSETNRDWSNSVIGEQAMRETDLLAFQIAIERGKPLSVMCGYNLVNGHYACGNDHLLNTVLKGDWGYTGFVMSDWGAVKATDFAVKGLDQQAAKELDAQPWFGAPLKAAIETGDVPASRLSDMVRRILYAQIASGIFDSPPHKTDIDYAAHARISRAAAEEGMVLLKNSGDLLPLGREARTILVIGDYVEKGVLSGGGSSNVTAVSGQPGVPMSGETLFAQYVKEQYHPSAPLAAIRARAPQATVLFDNGRNTAEAARKAVQADLVIVFGNQWMTESLDAPNLDLPRGQDAMISAVASANPKTVVVLQTGGPVTMPWLSKVPAVLQAWYSGAQGGEVIADILFGDVNPSGHLPMTFPVSLGQTPRPNLPGIDLPEKVQFDVVYHEGADIGYRWFKRTKQTPLFPFGFGLSYTTFSYSDLKLSGGDQLRLSFKVTNTGQRPGKAVPQVYLTQTPDGATQRLIGFDKVDLKPGETRTLTLVADLRIVGQFDTQSPGWVIKRGVYDVALGHSAADLIETGSVRLETRRLKP
ncbi:beta-glucosidase family protein [Asticcacaulis excentricus]|uniref:Beta-glucosidase n=1 Tax=Asticcacaulis excentricus (strain ATCC 15261 / DSM 4724 / KCTC 12464 / NCIMB 9791 / VKM B-1370 / CB 48) TaxID=573065 RepID=E8RUR8_ASTEC|nr:glycoside hydrolase family 3 C-terminal domain-containing protein [Asticcacaulis excentricus]ADU14118.1 Beta-glucosidase [Asticcacaulis excentricus CB 48]